MSEGSTVQWALRETGCDREPPRAVTIACASDAEMQLGFGPPMTYPLVTLKMTVIREVHIARKQHRGVFTCLVC